MTRPESAPPPPAFDALLSRLRGRVELALERRLPSTGVAPSRLHEAMRYAVLGGGKRVRAVLVYTAAAAFGVDEDAVDAPACAVEMVHAYSLVHDDLPAMDDDDLRRGRPTCHRAYDEATALLVGDALQAHAFEVLADDPTLAVDPARRVEMLGTLARASGSSGMAGGQAIDLAAVGKVLPLVELEDMHLRKTGALIRASVRLGALASEAADATAIQTLDDYARAIGLAFQIRDDILDVEGDTATLGKTQGADIARNKPTYPAAVGMTRAKAMAVEQHESALASLTGFDERADPLRWLSQYIVSRAS
ncbi:MAG: polyprenyl synthetase family protein [Ectothiorhodospiraceae bacterium]|nr:polyprenyl synthetase family protein [Ectothiorhodospiraceae bacterium]